MIPKVIHYCWFGGKPLPDSALRCIESWKRFCPDYEIRRWDESNYDYTKNSFMRQAYERRRFAFVADYARVDIIHQHGGVYFDTDVELLQPLDEFLKLEGFCGVERGSQCVAIGLGFGAQKGNAVIRAIMEDYEDRDFLVDGMEDARPAPLRNTPILAGLGFVCSEEVVTVRDMTVFPPKYFSPVNFQTGEIFLEPETVSIHHYDSSWYNETERYAAKLKKKLGRILPRRLAGRAAYFIAQCRYEGLSSAVKRVWSKLKKR